MKLLLCIFNILNTASSKTELNATVSNLKNFVEYLNLLSAHSTIHFKKNQAFLCLDCIYSYFTI